MYNPPATEGPRWRSCAARDVHAIAELSGGERSAVDARAAAVIADDREQAVGIPAVRFDRAHEHRAAPRRGDAAVIRIRGTDRAIALKTDCNGRYVALDPRVGAQHRRGRGGAQRRVHGRPAAWRSRTASTSAIRSAPRSTSSSPRRSRGMGEACLALGTPVTGGNVSFYNESPTGAVHPTPVIGMVGLIDSLAHITQRRVPHAEGDDDSAARRAAPKRSGGSEYLARIHGVTAGAPPRCDVPASARRSTRCSRRFARGRLVGARLQRWRPGRRAGGMRDGGPRRTRSAPKST